MIEEMDIKNLCRNLDIDDEDDDNKHGVIISSIGGVHTILWLFVPYMAVVYKAGEAFNESPLAFDNSAPQVIANVEEQCKNSANVEEQCMRRIIATLFDKLDLNHDVSPPKQNFSSSIITKHGPETALCVELLNNPFHPRRLSTTTLIASIILI